MNYTNPENPEHEDKPTDWLASSLIMTSALHHLLKENEGIVVDVKNDMKLLEGFEDVNKVFVYREDNQIKISECDDNLDEGQMIWMH